MIHLAPVRRCRSKGKDSDTSKRQLCVYYNAPSAEGSLIKIYKKHFQNLSDFWKDSRKFGE